MVICNLLPALALAHPYTPYSLLLIPCRPSPTPRTRTSPSAPRVDGCGVGPVCEAGQVLVVALDALSVVLVHDVNGGEYAERMEEAGLVDRLELMAIQCAADIANRAAVLLDRHFS